MKNKQSTFKLTESDPDPSDYETDFDKQSNGKTYDTCHITFFVDFALYFLMRNFFWETKLSDHQKIEKSSTGKILREIPETSFILSCACLSQP